MVSTRSHVKRTRSGVVRNYNYEVLDKNPKLKKTKTEKESQLTPPTAVITKTHEQACFDIKQSLVVINQIISYVPYSGTNENEPCTEDEAQTRYVTLQKNLATIVENIPYLQDVSDEKRTLLNDIIFEIHKWIEPLPYNSSRGDYAAEWKYVARRRLDTVEMCVRRMERLLMVYCVRFEVNIDFDGASREWKSNKVKLNDGCYRYRKRRRLRKN
jgi:hypothetical protein